MTISNAQIDLPGEIANLSKQVNTWAGSVKYENFSRLVGSFYGYVTSCVLVGERNNYSSIIMMCRELIGVDVELRRHEMVHWPTLSDLAAARLLSVCLSSPAHNAEDYNMLRQHTAWCKDVLTHFPIDREEDADHAIRFTFAAQLAYLLANRYLEPQARHIADAGIPKDFERTFGRVFADEALLRKMQEYIAILPGSNAVSLG